MAPPASTLLGNQKISRGRRRVRMPLLRRRPPGWDETTPDEELVGLARRGQREPFGLLYDRHHLVVYGYCYRCLGEREAAQDATGETFRKALAGLPACRPQAFRSW